MRSTVSASVAGSTVMMAPSRSEVSGFSSVCWKQLTPTILSSPASIRARRSACEETSSPFRYPDSTAAMAPPISWIRSISARQSATRESTLASMTWDPAKMSSYSSRSLSSARTCWMRSDHCWSQGRGRPSASFQAGNCTARARASLERVTASISSTMRWTLFSGCASVSPRELTWTP